MQIDMLGRSSVYRTTTNATCKRLNLSANWVSPLANPFSLYISTTGDIGHLPPLSTFHVTLHLEGNNSEEISCREANITPALSPTITSVITYSTWALFIFVFLVGIARSAYSTPITLDDGEPRSVRTVLPNVGDCLQYLQFIFLTGGLSLRYPGFYQPVVSHLSWLSLFVNGPITHGRVYERVEDGIYVLNGTYGGTYGLELMTQIAGAPMTMDTWLNMVVLIFVIAASIAVVLEVFWFVTRDRNSDSGPSRLASGMRQTCSRVLLAILSYFMFPLAALSFYQLDHASWLPIYHTSLAAMLIVAMMAAFVWLIRQIPTRNLGVLVFDSTKRYRQVPPSEDFRRQDERFIFILFALTLVRGAAVGGLQISGLAQLTVLGACELVLLASIAGFQAYATFSVGSIAATIRLCSLIFLVTFLPGISTNGVKSAIGYLLLTVHAGMLVLGFFVPAACDLGDIIKSWWKTPKPDVYGLRQLRRRGVSRTNLSSMYTTDGPDTSYPGPDGVEEPDTSYLRPTYRSNSPSTLRLNPSTASSRYFRPPRSSASISSADHPRSIGTSLYTPSRTASSSTSVIDKRSIQRSISTASPSRLSESIREEEVDSTSHVPQTSVNGVPLGPRWSDYSFREADLYYGVPRPPPVERASEELPRPAAPRPSFRSSSGFWAKVTGQAGTSEQDFQVVRPRPPPEMGFVIVRPNRPSNFGDGSGGGAPRSPCQGD
ncbi:integral membrane protein [Colletotrichum tofieldiae]|nr:integral membrane protein [Colletotrichum tofieldiae]GKT72818.1 integral membrane protein [Colletotrichum tofieldiae]